jgi:integrase
VLQRRRLTYTSRIVVPAHLRATLGRSEITRSLRTQDRREALNRLKVWETHVGRLLTTLGRRGAAMTREEIDLLVARYLSETFDQIEERLDLDWHEVDLDQHRWSLADRAHALTGGLYHANPAATLQMAREAAPNASESVLRRLARRLMEAQLVAIKAELNAFGGEPLERPVILASSPAPTTAPPKATPKLSYLTRQYGDEQMARQRWSLRTENQYRGYLAVLTQMLGDPCIGDVTKEDLRRFGLDVARLPSNLTKKFPGRTHRQALEEAGDNPDVPRLAPNTINSHYQITRTFFSWAVNHDHLPNSPAIVLKNVAAGRASDQRLPFDDDDLLKYFRRLDSKRGLQPFEWWIARIMAYSGCRLGEAAQLCTHDIRQVKGIWVLDINETDDEQRVKTDASRRLVPMHEKLVELGLPDHAASSPPGFLWPKEMRTHPNPNASPVDRLQKRLNYIFDTSGIDHPKKTASHSFRHTVSSRLKDQSIAEYQIAEILGHETGSLSTNRYGTTTDLATLKKVIDLVSLPDPLASRASMPRPAGVKKD